MAAAISGSSNLDRNLERQRREAGPAGERGFPSRAAVVEQYVQFMKSLRDDWRERWLEELASALPERVRQQLDAISSSRKQTDAWLRLLAEASPRGPGEYFASLDNQQIERLLAMPTADMQQEIQQAMAEQIAPPDWRREMQGRRPFGAPPGPPPGDFRGRRGPPPPRN